MKNIVIIISLLNMMIFGNLLSQDNTNPNQPVGEGCLDSEITTVISIDTVVVVNVDVPTEILDDSNTPPTSPEDDDPRMKNVFLVHGLSGAPPGWAKAAGWIAENYLAITHRPTYGQNETVIESALELRNDLGDANYTLEQDFPGSKGTESIYIGHSLGGIMGRELDRAISNIPNHPHRFGAFASFGSPHQGAEIIDNIQNGNVEQYLYDVCNVVSDIAYGHLLNLFPDAINIFNFIFPKRVDSLKMFFKRDLPEAVETAICEVGFPIGFDIIKAEMAPKISNDLATTSSYMEELNNHVFSLPNVAFYGVETGTFPDDDGKIDGRAALREIYSLHIDINAGPFGTQQDDTGYFALFDSTMARVQANALYYMNEMVSYPYKFWAWPWQCWNSSMPLNAECLEAEGYYYNVGGIGFGYGICFNKCVKPKNAFLSKSYRKLERMMADFDKMYRIFFGHLTLDYVQTGTFEFCICEHPILPDGLSCQDLVDAGFDITVFDCTYESHPIFEIVENNIPGDAVVTAASQSYFPGVRNTKLMNDLNHQELRNSPATKQGFEDMFGGDKYGWEFFLFPK